ncbi:MAG: DMT family transporter [Candidatus Coatesbacteria bacterium]
MTTAEARARHSRGVMMALAAGVLWSLGGLLIKWVEWNPVAIAGARSAIAAVVLLVWIRRPRFTWSATQVGAAVAYAATVIMFVSANKLTTSANAILLQYTAPVYTALFGWWFLRERVTWVDWVTVAVVLGGMFLFFLDRLTVGGLWGNILALSSGVTFAGMATLLRKQKDASPLESILLGNVLTALIGLPFMFQGGPGGSTWVGLILLGVFQLGLSYVVYVEAVKRITALEAILVTTIEPILNPLWVFLVLHEVPGPWAIVGGIVIVGAVTVRYAVIPPRGARRERSRR